MTNQTQPTPWDQQQGESNQSYVRFLVYRNIGPVRTVKHAYAAATGKELDKIHSQSSTWDDDCAHWNWVQRATAWDIAQLASTVPESTTIIFKLIADLARMCLAEVQEGKLKPKSFAELTQTVMALASLISPEVISAIINHTAHRPA